MKCTVLHTSTRRTTVGASAIDRVLVSTDNNGSIALSRNGGDDAGLAPSVLELGNLGALGSTGRDDRLNLLEQPVRGLFTV